MTSPALMLRILHTNDLHSHFEQMPSIAAAFRELRRSAGDTNTLTLDIGDHLDRMHAATEGTEGTANIAVMNETGYDAVTIGNNEGLTFTPAALAALYGEKSIFKVLCSNLLNTETGRIPGWAVPSHVVEKGGIRVGLIGVTAYFTEFYRLLGWDILEPHTVAARLVGELRPHVDLIVVLSHLGLRNDERMAQEIQGIDLILGGHTHHLLETPLRIGSTMVCAAGKHGQHFGVVDIEFDRETRKPVSMEGYVRSTADFAPDAQVSRDIEQFERDAGKVLAREVARLDYPLFSDWYAEAPLGNLLATGLRKRVGADIGLVNAGQCLEGLQAGPVTAGRLLEICPSPINPCRMLLTGARLRQALEESLLPEFMEKPLFGFGFRGKVLGMLNVDGLRIQYDAAAPDYAKIREIRVGDEVLQEEKEYVVATIDMFTFGIGYHSLSEGTEVTYYLPEFLRDVLKMELRDAQAVRECTVPRWHRVKLQNGL
ncbi:bifunctional metallophosphatase/5'-nucleotidase [Paenibacillus xerothermodurans]|uniref:Bifunctional metallophosphatase/5'-nucleotidase n=1 Tax=Paenibacillus xerothermodurans TaxID=1977292 RepID=A0A2W1NRD7_PAEXE|nr:bifunctional UDP-sugar hydrolase/5'-nucleotidase [Paenibacillus xerothermodurans]PZE21443.1 bifunctional metallophosphatase/5'-nucleotidase [Paenibacillus xerothermodurans]